VGYNDPVVHYGMAIAQRIKVTLGITGLLFSRVHIDRIVWHLDVDSSYPGVVGDSKGSAVRRVKGYVSWVKYVVIQYGSYLRTELISKWELTVVREEPGRTNLWCTSYRTTTLPSAKPFC